MTNKQLLDMLWNKFADLRNEAAKDWDHYTNIQDSVDAKVAKGKFLAYTAAKEIVFDLYRSIK